MVTDDLFFLLALSMFEVLNSNSLACIKLSKFLNINIIIELMIKKFMRTLVKYSGFQKDF